MTAVTLLDDHVASLRAHGHESFDDRLGVTQAVCNSHVYDAENRRFDPALMVEIPS